MKKLFLILSLSLLVLSCAGVDSGHRGVEKSWGGETNMTTVYPEGINWGFHWVWDSMIEYDVRETTVVQKFQFNDSNNMNTGVEVSLDFHLSPKEVNLLHSKIGKDNIEVKILKTLKSSAKEVVSQYTASELNLTKRQEAEAKLTSILEKELPTFYVIFDRVQLTDVDIPKQISDAAEATAKQQELNKLALEKAQEAQNNYKAAEWDSKTKEVLSKPAMLSLKQLELQEAWIKKWNGSFGNNNVFGEGSAMILKGMK